MVGWEIRVGVDNACCYQNGEGESYSCDGGKGEECAVNPGPPFSVRVKHQNYCYVGTWTPEVSHPESVKLGS